jgi:hypothetical protein
MRSLLCLSLIASTAFAADTHKLTRVYEKLVTERPIAVVIPEDGSGRQFLALQRGQILILPKDEQAAEAKTFLDLSPVAWRRRTACLKKVSTASPSIRSSRTTASFTSATRCRSRNASSSPR